MFSGRTVEVKSTLLVSCLCIGPSHFGSKGCSPCQFWLKHFAPRSTQGRWPGGAPARCHWRTARNSLSTLCCVVALNVCPFVCCAAEPIPVLLRRCVCSGGLWVISSCVAVFALAASGPFPLGVPTAACGFLWWVRCTLLRCSAWN